MEDLYRLCYEDIQLKPTAILLGLVLVSLHLAAWFQQDAVRAFLPKFPRHREIGIGLLLAGTAWSYWLVCYMDLGEFYAVEKFVKFALPLSFALLVYHAPEFLAVRATGILLMLLAGPVLQAAFLEAPFTRLLLPIIAYVWIIVGMFWVGMPYLMRDWIDWIIAKDHPKRWSYACGIGAGYGLLMILCAATWQV
ncbi:MAG: hypothetical protein KGS60_06445 [Verrucomicrobia bacterium]|nr:hypothetical protein [Verrucomicrobiota bacterium]